MTFEKAIFINFEAIKTMNKDFIKRMGAKTKAINRLIGQDVQFYLDGPTGVFYAKILTNDAASECVYIEHLPKGLMNIFRRRAIVSASIKIAGSTLILMCNGRHYELRRITFDLATFHAPCFCVYDLTPLRFMGEESNSMFIGDFIYSSDSRHGLWQIVRNGRQLVVALTNAGPEVVEGVRTTMHNGDYQNYYWGAFPDEPSFNIYGLTILNPFYYRNNEIVFVRYPIFEPITPKNAYINGLNQLTVDGRNGSSYSYNNVMNFERVIFHKGEDWPIEVIKAGGESARFNLILSDIDDRGRRDPYLIDKNNIAHEFNCRRPFTELIYEGNNRFGSLKVVAKRAHNYSSYMYDQESEKIGSDILNNYCEPLEEYELHINAIVADDADNHYAIYDGDEGPAVKKIHLRSVPAKRTKAALHGDSF